MWGIFDRERERDVEGAAKMSNLIATENSSTRRKYLSTGETAKVYYKRWFQFSKYKPLSIKRNLYHSRERERLQGQSKKNE